MRSPTIANEMACTMVFATQMPTWEKRKPARRLELSHAVVHSAATISAPDVDAG